MFHLKYLFYFILLHWILAIPQINLYYTDLVNVSKNKNEFQHNCLHFVSPTKKSNDHRKIISYCLSELPSKFHFETNDYFPKFTFAELKKQNITSQQLYLWSASIDLIERYQLYLNDSSSTTGVFYNCTLPRFGPMCQYEFIYYHSHHSSLYEIIQDFYRTYEYQPTTFTCYEHLQCNRGPDPVCLDWTEICNGKIDCFDSRLDEENCWQLEINECQENEYRCENGQCIPESFYLNGDVNPFCLDKSDAIGRNFNVQLCDANELSFGCDDMTCDHLFLTSSCVAKREDLIWQAMFSVKDKSLSENCWLAVKCILNIPGLKREFCMENECIKIIENSCSNIFYFPNVPFFFNDIYLAYMKNDIPNLLIQLPQLPYLCYNNSRYDDYFINTSKIIFNNAACFRPKITRFIPALHQSWVLVYQRYLQVLYGELSGYHSIMNYTAAFCNRSNMYQCLNSSKCISIYRLNDNKFNCPFEDDENLIHVLEIMKKTHFKCQSTGQYIPLIRVKNYVCDCGHIEDDWCEDENLEVNIIRRNISFQTICDGFVELASVLIEDRNETDETECQQWECNNIYTRCNGIWNCPNGADEAGCISSSTINCSSKDHLCVSPYSNQLMCLSIDKANDGNIDCLGATDEPILCRVKMYTFEHQDRFHCVHHNAQLCLNDRLLCDHKNHCENDDDEQFCDENRTIAVYDGICRPFSFISVSNVEKFLCKRFISVKSPLIYFSINGPTEPVIDLGEDEKFSDSSMIEMFHQHQFRCHRGLDLRVWLNDEKNITTNTCFCPPSYYGDQCQYQNQRISLTIKFRAFSDSWQTLFAVVISLIDDSNERIIHSYEQFTYLSLRDCQVKFNIYLIYSTRPKDPTKQYAIHIDFYEKHSLNYRGSILLPIKFPFLPVHRLSFIVDIPRINDKIQSCSYDRCIRGRCIRYSNNQENFTFCQCNEGWSGRYCTIQHTCSCASDSLCIGISADNRSICVCPMNKFGSRCLLIDTVCQNDNTSKCENGGQCVPTDGQMIFNRMFTCICPKGFSGDRCEIADNQLVLSFDKEIVLSQSLFIHFIQVLNNNLPIRGTTFQTIPIQKDAIIIRWSQPFHLIFTELDKKIYYLTVIQTTYNRSTTINRTIHVSDRCPNITELFNQTFLQWHLLRQIKYYHLPCQNQSLNLSCFYDDVHLCLCYTFNEKRLANCFHFDHTMKMDCFGQNECENDGQCFQDRPDCPQKSLCKCQPCFYGRRCQFSTSGFGLSLDMIIGYHIIPDVRVSQQPAIVQFTLALTIIFMVTGLINSVLCIVTFKNKSVRAVGCGLYLLASSITTLFIVVVFGLKFLILLLAQITIISNRSFLQIQCYSIDFILRIFLYMDQWLNACVAIERAITAIKAIRFDKKKSQQAAKIVITILSIVIVSSCIHEPIYRRLIDEGNNDDDNDVKRIWCIVTYSSGLNVYNSAIHIFHFFGPFIINLVSSIILITKQSRQQANIHTQRSYKQILRQQFQQHKHLLTAPMVLVILAIPRLIIAVVSKCMKSSDDAWLYLIGYFISFIPPMLTFVVFIVPSKFYKKEFRKSVNHYRNTLQGRFHLTS
jgi:hypothetical protein